MLPSFHNNQSRYCRYFIIIIIAVYYSFIYFIAVSILFIDRRLKEQNLIK